MTAVLVLWSPLAMGGQSVSGTRKPDARVSVSLLSLQTWTSSNWSTILMGLVCRGGS